jgi:hypothetical protein
MNLVLLEENKKALVPKLNFHNGLSIKIHEKLKKHREISIWRSAAEAAAFK